MILLSGLVAACKRIHDADYTIKYHTIKSRSFKELLQIFNDGLISRKK